MRINKQTAAHHRMGGAGKTRRIYSSVGNITISMPQPKTEMDLIQGVHVLRYVTYVDTSVDVKVEDKIIHGTDEYIITEVLMNNSTTLKHKKIKMLLESG